MRAIQKAAEAWYCRVYLFEGKNILARGSAPCRCKGLGLVPRELPDGRYTFDPCKNPECESSGKRGLRW